MKKHDSRQQASTHSQLIHCVISPPLAYHVRWQHASLLQHAQLLLARPLLVHRVAALPPPPALPFFLLPFTAGALCSRPSSLSLGGRMAGCSLSSERE